MSQYSQSSWILFPQTANLLNLQSEVQDWLVPEVIGAFGSHCSPTAVSTLQFPHIGVYAHPQPHPPHPQLLMITLIPVEAVLLVRLVSPEVWVVAVLV